MDGAPRIDGGAGMSAPEMGQSVHAGVPNTSPTPKSGVQVPHAGHGNQNGDDDECGNTAEFELFRVSLN